MTSAYEHLLVERDGGVAVITLNRPKVLNALSIGLLRELDRALEEIDADDAVLALIVTGAGEKAFAAGADIGELNALPGAVAGAAQARFGQSITRKIERLRVPVIMAINGFALGGGNELAMAGDIRIASDNAKFGQPEVNIGIMPGYGGTQRTTRLLGKGMAMYLNLTGEMIDAHEAHRCGLVEKVVPLPELLTEAKRIANIIASRAPLGIAATKRAVSGGAHLPIDDALEIEALAFGTLIDSEDFKEGTSAFLEKRKANWQAR
jgi:enoyl-CoA hydratase